MKKLIVFFLTLTALSCSNDEQVDQDVLKDESGSVLEGKMLSFKTEESFVEEYSNLAQLNTNELKAWVSSKKLIALLNVSDDSVEIEEDVLPKSRLVYSDALKAVLNSDSKVKIGGKVLWLNERTFYLLKESDVDKTSDELVANKENLKAFGQLLSLSGSAKSLTSRGVIPNENRTKTFESDEMDVQGGRLRHVLDLFNETIVLNDQIQTSKMYLRSTLQYRSCSTWRCTWKEAMNARTIASTYYDGSSGDINKAWTMTGNIYAPGVSGTQTFLVANWKLVSPLSNWYPNFVISGNVTCQVDGSTFTIPISWY